MSRSRSLVPTLRVGIALVAFAAAVPAAHAGVTYRLDRPSAAPGETVLIEAVFFNDTPTGAAWSAPRRIVVQWRGATGQPIRTTARAVGAATEFNVPVNNFARMSWQAVVPTQARGLQAVSIEGQAALMALDATGRESGTTATMAANTPVVDARTGEPLPPAEVTRLGASPDVGPAPEQTAMAQPNAIPTAFNSFTSSLSAYQPVYFAVGTRGGTTARFQLSAKYRLFTPEDAATPKFYENLYLGYTQTSLWDLQGDSKPFIDTTFNPSAFWLNENLWTSANQNWRFGSAAGIEHKSNGKAGDDSRSLNDFYLQPSFNYRFDGGSTLSFAPKIMSYVAVARENSDYSDYNGHVDWRVRWAQDNGPVVSAMYRQGDQKRRTTQVDLAYPLKQMGVNANGYVYLQYFNGYGETLLGYDERNRSQFRIGLSLVP